MHLAATYFHYDAIEMLIGAGTDLNALDKVRMDGKVARGEGKGECGMPIVHT